MPRGYGFKVTLYCHPFRQQKNLKKAAWSTPVQRTPLKTTCNRSEQSHPSISAELAWYIYTLRRRSRGLGRRTQTATCTNTHRARAVAANSNDDAFTTSFVPFMSSPELMPTVLAFAVILGRIAMHSVKMRPVATHVAWSVCLSRP